MLKSQKLKEDMKEKWGEIKALRDKVVKEDREYTQDEKDLVEKTLDEVGAIEEQIKTEQAQEALNSKIDAADQMFAAPQPPAQPKQQKRAAVPQQMQVVKTVGQQLVESEEWKQYAKGITPGATQIPGPSPPINIKGFLDGYGRKELVTGLSNVSAGAFVVADQSGIYEQIGRYPLLLRQLIDVRQTMSDTVEWVEQTRQATEAAPVPEANVTDYSGATGEESGEKPEGVNRWIRRSTTVKTIAIWKPATTRALADVPQLRSMIDGELRDDVNEELENQMLNGNGVGENLTGLNNTAGVLVQAFTTDIAVTARMAITNLLINGRQIPTAFMFNPQDWEAYDLLTDANNQYYWGGPIRPGPMTLWGVPVAQSFFQTAGTGWLGNFRKMVLWDREQATVAVSDSHADFFIRNMVAIRCELRAAMGIIRPTGFVQLDLTSGS